ncbi:MAG: DUF1302 domain-containing protein [Desulfobacterales bacterium]|nr:DUF1302 domain-containing protein [Desulfobacterales bacterium]
MKTNFLGKGKTWLLAVLFLFVGVASAGAEIQLWGDKLTVTGFLRHQLVYNMGSMNPYNGPPRTGYGVQSEKNDINLSRTWFVSEFNYRPSHMFKLFAKTRLIYDQTDMLDDNLPEYNSMALSTEHYGSTLRADHDDNVAAEIWELYGDLDIGNLWFRLGKQQIVWGEMISARILDIVNPLDLSWHMKWEPEEFENIRIPQWMIRAVYNIEQAVAPWLDELYVEAFYNPGDIVPTNNSQIGAPYRLNMIPTQEWGGPYRPGEVVDRRGHEEFGGRMGYKIGQFAGTFNFAYLYTDDPYSEVGMPGPPWIPSTWPVTKDYYPQIEVYGLSLNYAMDRPFNTVVTLEATYTPDMPYYDINVFPGISIRNSDTIAYAINFQRFTKILSSQPFMNVIFQYQGLYIEDGDNVKLTPGPMNDNNICETIANDAFVLSLSQDFFYKTYKATCVIIWQPDGSYRINPGFKYSPGDNWRFEIFANWWGGTAFDGANKHQLNYFADQDEVMARITYQF